mmetsp:Transcript_4176/g.10855  ORF Transcript_4176/g.10855 Transcript_4176/m.10855 type:complete len:213 (-) Transcript_4176:876-1514(-)
MAMCASPIRSRRWARTSCPSALRPTSTRTAIPSAAPSVRTMRSMGCRLPSSGSRATWATSTSSPTVRPTHPPHCSPSASARCRSRTRSARSSGGLSSCTRAATTARSRSETRESRKRMASSAWRVHPSAPSTTRGRPSYRMSPRSCAHSSRPPAMWPMASRRPRCTSVDLRWCRCWSRVSLGLCVCRRTSPASPADPHTRSTFMSGAISQWT